MSTSSIARLQDSCKDSMLDKVFDFLLGEDLSVRRFAPLGVGESGKTTLLKNIPRVDLESLPSGLGIGYPDTKALNEALRTCRDANKALRESGLEMTLNPELYSMLLFEDNSPCLRLAMMDLGGQAITHSFPDSKEEQLARMDQNLAETVLADVVHLYIPVPPSDDPLLLGQFRDSMRTCKRFLLDVMKIRQSPMALAIVVTKIDLLVSSAKEARDRLTPEWLTSLLEPVLSVVRNDRGPRGRHLISASAIIPVTSFGFGRAIARTPTSNGQRPSSSDEHRLMHALNGAMDCQPFNLDTLVLWSTIAAIQVRPHARDFSRMRSFARALRQDLRDFDGWHVPVIGE